MVATTEFIQQFTALIKKIEELVEDLCNSSQHISQQHSQDIRKSTRRLTACTDRLTQLKELHNAHLEPAIENGHKLVNDAHNQAAQLIESGCLNNEVIKRIRSNISFLYGAPPSPAAPGKYERRRKRCESITALSLDGLLCLGITYFPSSWMLMNNDTFDYIILNIERLPMSCAWPADVYKILRGVDIDCPRDGRL